MNARISIDSISKEKASERVKNYIRNKFTHFLCHRNKKRFAEKTLANSLRLSFVKEVLPNCKIIHIIRDGRDVALSTKKKLRVRGANIKNISGENRSTWRNFQIRLKKIRQIHLYDFPFILKIFCWILLIQNYMECHLFGDQDFPTLERYQENAL